MRQRELYESDDLIELPDELKEVENILNEIKAEDSAQ